MGPIFQSLQDRNLALVRADSCFASCVTISFLFGEKAGGRVKEEERR